MAKPQVYINLSQCIAITGVVVLGVHYLNVTRDATGIQKVKFNERIKKDAGKVIDFLATPFRRYF